MSLRTALLAITALLGGCFIPDDYDPCDGYCPDAQVVARRDAPNFDTGPLLANVLGTTTSAMRPPPALAGGTLVSLGNGRAVLGDPDTDTIRMLDPTLPAQVGQVSLSPGDEPGRLVVDGAGRVHVVLRGAGAVATIDVSDPSTPLLTARRSVCPVPRGIAYDGTRDVLYVACMGGELVTLPPVGPPQSTAQLLPDLRDVVLQGAQLLVTRFRSSDVLVVDPIAGTVLHTLHLASSVSGGHMLAPAVAWRAIVGRSGVFVLHQAHREDVSLSPDGMLGSATCGDAAVQARLTRLNGATLGSSITLPCAVLAVDAAVSPSGSSIAIAIAGATPRDACHQLMSYALSMDGLIGTARSLDCTAFAGRVVAVAYAPDGSLLAQTRAPLGLVVVSPVGATRDIQLPGPLVLDTGFDVFHSSTSDHIACASCHPEGGDDGHVWTQPDGEPRRTMPLRGGVLATAPFDWHGERPTFASVLDDVLSQQMNGGSLTTDEVDVTARWLDARPALALGSIPDVAAVARGQTLFESAALGCGSCHAGARFSSQATVDVGTGGAFQVPSLLGLGYRAPFMHDGCAAALRDVFGPCARAGVHGIGATLSSAELDDLVAYLSSL